MLASVSCCPLPTIRRLKPAWLRGVTPGTTGTGEMSQIIFELIITFDKHNEVRHFVVTGSTWIGVLKTSNRVCSGAMVSTPFFQKPRLGFQGKANCILDINPRSYMSMRTMRAANESQIGPDLQDWLRAALSGTPSAAASPARGSQPPPL